MKIVLFRYLNSEPLRYLAKSLSLKIIDVTPRDLLNTVDDEEPDIVLTPITYIRELQYRNYRLSNLVIASRGPVKSVCVLSSTDTHVNDIRTIYATRESVVSIRVLRHILEKRGIVPNVVLVDIALENISQIIRRGPVLVIGDVALVTRKFYRTVLDVAREWFRMYYKPLIFAVLMYRPARGTVQLVRKFSRVVTCRRFLRYVSRSTSHWVSRYLSREEILQYLTESLVYVINNVEKHVAFLLSKLFSNLQSGNPV